MKTFKEEIVAGLMSSSTLYCCYCNSRRDGKISCCSENHFVPFADLDQDVQDEMIQEEIYEYEEWVSCQV